MKHETNCQKKQTPIQQKRKTAEDQNLLMGLPLRLAERRKQAVEPSRDWVASVLCLRIPLLLLGVVGALGLLALDNPRFARLTHMIDWPEWRVSMTFLGLAGYVIALLTIEWLYVTTRRWVRRKENTAQSSWRCR